MGEVTLEHANVTVSDIDQTARLFERLFGWRIRWKGEAKNGGTSIHVGGDTSYVALYTPQRDAPLRKVDDPGLRINGLNHLAVVVDDLDGVEARVVAERLTPYNHGDYEPGRRFYFNLPDGLEIEVVSYR